MELIRTPALRKNLIDFLVQEARRNSPEVKQLSHSLNASENRIKYYSSGRFMPQVAVQGQYNRKISAHGKGSSYPLGYPVPPDGSYNVGVSATFPIFSRNSNRINRETAQLQKVKLKIDKNNLEASISLNIHNGVLDLLDEISSIELSKVSEKSAKEALKLTQNAYSTGAVNIVQLMDAQNNYIKTQQAKANATYNYLLKMLQLERYLGNYFLLNTREDFLEFNRRFEEFRRKNSR